MKEKYDVQLFLEELESKDILLNRSFQAGGKIFISIGLNLVIYFENKDQAQLFVGKIVQEINKLNM